MDIEVHIRVTCSGWRCRGTGHASVFEGFVPAKLLGDDNVVALKRPLPEGWGTQHFSDMGTDEPLCPACLEANNRG